MSARGFAKQLSWAAFGRFGAMTVNLAALVIISRYLGPTEFGRFALAQAAAITAYSVLFYWLVASITRLSALQDNVASFRGALLIGFAIAGGATVALGAGGGLIATRLGIPHLGYLPEAAVAAALGEAAYMRGLEHFRAFAQSSAYAALTLSRATGALLAAILGFHYIEITAEVALFGYAAGCFGAAIAFEFVHHSKVRLDSAWRRHLAAVWRFGNPLSAALIFRLAIQRLDRFVIGAVFGPEATGLYALAFDFANRALGIPLMVLNIVTYPAMINAWNAEKPAEMERMARFNWNGLLLIGLPSAFGLILVASDAIAILFGAAYASPTATMIASIAGFCMLGEAMKIYHLDIAFMLSEKTKDQIRLTAAAFLANAGGCFLIIPMYGAIGAAIVAFLTVVLLAALSFLRGRKLLAIPMPMSALFGILVCCAIMGGGVFAFGTSSDPTMLVLKILVGMALYGGSVYLLNVAGCRTVLRDLTNKGTAGS